MGYLIPLALNLEAMALLFLTSGIESNWVMLAYFGSHGLASIILAVPIWRTLPAELRLPAPLVLFWLFLFNLLAPTSILWVRLAIWLGHKYRLIRKQDPVGTVFEPVYSIYRRNEKRNVRSGRLRTQLTADGVAADDRMSALLSIQEVPASVTADLLRQLLADPLDDIRLLAYGMLDGKEKAISQRLLAEEKTLKEATADDERFGAHKRLAELQWELVFQKLVQGDMRLFACRQARTHAQAALNIKSDDAGIWFLLGRVNLVLRDLAAGQQALGRAQQCGLPRTVVIPYLAEYAYAERQFAKIAALYGELTAVPGALQLASSYTYWTGR